MIVYPVPGQTVELRYRPSLRRLTALHGRLGVVRIVSRGPGPRNHGIAVEGHGLVVVPCGQLMKVKAERGETLPLFDRETEDAR